MHVTLQDVARLAAVSTKTVSRVVNNQGEISEATRERVQASIDQLGYRPNFLARSLVSQRSHSLGVVTSGLEYYGPSSILTGIEQESYELGYSLLFSLLPDPDVLNIAPILDSFVARRVDGIIWAVAEINNNRAWIRPEVLENLPPIVFLSMSPRPWTVHRRCRQPQWGRTGHTASDRHWAAENGRDHRAAGVVGITGEVGRLPAGFGKCRA
jgi:LacI family transcriptional regulator